MITAKQGKLYRISSRSRENIAIFSFPEGHVIDIIYPDSDFIFMFLGKLPPNIFNDRLKQASISYIRYKILLANGTLAYINVGHKERHTIVYYDPNFKLVEVLSVSKS
jgi:hypothetical protein